MAAKGYGDYLAPFVKAGLIKAGTTSNEHADQKLSSASE